MSKELIDLIKEIPISTIVEHYMPLKKNGAAKIGVCPFHADTKPSMHVTDSKGIFKCFACGTGGDSLVFVQKFLNLTFPETLKEVCNVTGIPYENYVKTKAISPELVMARRVLSVAQRIYSKVGTDGHPEFAKFIKERNLDEATSKDYSLGFAPKGNILYNYLNNLKDRKDRDFALKVAKDILIINQNDKGEFYDKFRERVMFPIWDLYGNLTGFTARLVHDWQKGKYINSNDSIVFNKSNILFGLNKTKNSIREKDFAIITEGHMDHIVLQQNGFTNSVAIMGLAMSDNSILSVARFSKNFYMALDTDTAGFNATKRLFPALVKLGVETKYINYSPYKDADELIQEKGSLEFQKRVDEALPLVEVLLDEICPEKRPDKLEEKIDILHKAYEIIAPYKKSLNAIERICSFAKKIGLNASSEDIANEYKEYLDKISEREQKSKSFTPQNFPNAAPQNTVKSIEQEIIVENTPEQNSQHIEIKQLTKSEISVIKAIILNPEIMMDAKYDNLCNKLDNSILKGYVSELRDIFENVDDSYYPQVLVDDMNNKAYPLEFREVIFNIISSFRQIPYDAKAINKIINDLIFNIELNTIQKKIMVLDIKLKGSITEEQKNSFSLQKLELQQEKSKLKSKK